MAVTGGKPPSAEAIGPAVGREPGVRPASIDGRVEAIRNGSVRGWVWAEGDPERRLGVRVAVDGEPVAETVADLHLPRLQSAGIGDGAHGYEVALPPSTADGQRHAVSVLAGPDEQPLRADLDFSVMARLDGPFAGTEFVIELPQTRPPEPPGQALVLSPASVPMVNWTAYAPRSQTAPYWLLAVACLAYIAFAAYLTRHFSFFQDDYTFLLQRRGWTLNTFLTPDDQHLMPTLILFYKVLWVTVGLHPFWPYQLPVIFAHVSLVIAIYVLASRRMGPWPALVPAGLMLIVFPGYEDMLWALLVCTIGSVSACLWAIVCLERGGRRRDVCASVLICLAIFTFSTGLFIALAIGVGLAISNRRRTWVVGVPLLLYALWYLHWGKSDIVWSNLSSVPSYDLHIAGYGFAGVLGIGWDVLGTKALLAGYVLLAAAVAGIVYLAARRRLSVLTIVAVVGALTLWTGTALARAGDAEPQASRYLYCSAALIVLGLIGAVPPKRLSLRVAGVIGAWGAVALVETLTHTRGSGHYVDLTSAAIVLVLVVGRLAPGRASAGRGVVAATALLAAVGIVAVGVRALDGYARGRATYDAVVRERLRAVQIAGPAARRTFVVDAHLMGGITAGNWLSIVHSLGSSNAFSVARIRQRTAGYQLDADATLIGAEGLVLRPPLRPPAGASCTTPSGRSSAGSSSAGLLVSADPGATVYVSAAPHFPLRLFLRRISVTFPSAPQFSLRAGRSARLVLPRDASPLPWAFRATPAGSAGSDAARVCVARAADDA